MKSFEQWMAETAFPDGTMPVSADVKRLMRMTWEACLHAQEATVLTEKDEQVIDWLVKERRFSPTAAEKCLRTFKETMRFAGIEK